MINAHFRCFERSNAKNFNLLKILNYFNCIQISITQKFRKTFKMLELTGKLIKYINNKKMKINKLEISDIAKGFECEWKSFNFNWDVYRS